jgi:toxin ParE1/3/4
MRIRWTEFAARDLTGICDYIRERNGPDTAYKTALRIYESIGGLVQFPHRGRRGRKSGTRELVLAGTPFVVIYRIHEDVIEITRILHGAQKWP